MTYITTYSVCDRSSLTPAENDNDTKLYFVASKRIIQLTFVSLLFNSYYRTLFSLLDIK